MLIHSSTGKAKGVRFDKVETNEKPTAGQRATYVMDNVSKVQEMHTKLAEELSSKTPNEKSIKKYKEIVACCKSSIASHLEQIVSKEDKKDIKNIVKKIYQYLDDDKVEDIEYTLLTLLEHRNPGKYAYQLKIAQQQYGK